MVQVHVRNLHVADVDIAGQFLEVETSHQVVERNRKVVTVHLPSEESLEAAVWTVQAVDIHAVASAVCRLKKREALYVVPVSVTDEQVHFEVALGIFLGKHNAQLADTGTAVKDENLFAASDFHTRGVAAITNRLGTGCCDRSPCAPKLHAKNCAP